VWVNVFMAGITSVQDVMHVCENRAQSLNMMSSRSFESAEEGSAVWFTHLIIKAMGVRN